MKPTIHSSRYLTLFAASLLGLTTHSLRGAVIFSSNFEGGTPFSQWTVNDTDNEVGGDSTITAVSGAQSPGSAGTAGARIDRVGNTSLPAPAGLSLDNTNLNGAAGGVTTATTYFQFDAKFAANTLNPSILINNTTSLLAADTAILLHLRDANGVIQNREGASGINDFVNVGSPVIADDTWYRYTLTIDLTADTYALRLQTIASESVDETYTGLLFRNAQTNLDRARFAMNTGLDNGNEGTFDLDNVIFTDNVNDLNFSQIPEPKMAMLGLLGACVALRRRRA